MQRTNPPAGSLQQILVTLRREPKRWLVPAAVGAVLSLCFALVYHPQWDAVQTLTVRQEAGRNDARPGRFDDAEDLKHAQETILELAKSPSVVAAALQKVGPPAGYGNTGQWPTPEDVDSARNRIELIPPNGAEFGTTELFYIVVSNKDRQRALQLASAVCDQFETCFKAFRNQKTESVIAELTNTVQLSQNELKETTDRLAAMESSVGRDLVELRMLNESTAGESNLQSTLVEVQQELRQANSEHQTNEQLLNLLAAAQNEPSHLVATPNRLLETQPALRRLKEGLIDAQLNTSRLLGTMSKDHPRVQAALVAEEEIRGHLHRELELAIRGLRAELGMNRARIDVLTGQVADLQKRMNRLADMRAAYGNLVAESQKRTDVLTAAQQELTAARASLAASQSTSLVARIGDPQTGPYAAGPGRTVIVAAGSLGGLLVGLGLVFLTVTTPETPHHPATAAGAVPAMREVPIVISPAPAKPARSLSLKDALSRFADDPNTWN